MHLHESGILCFTEQYEQMIAFYEHSLRLPVRARKPYFTVFDFGQSYLMIEPYVPGHVMRPVANGPRTPFVLRLNVFDFVESVVELQARGLAVEVQHFAWGQVGTLTDPDGNVIELKDAPDLYE
jgi:hypothetical protein